MPTEKQVRKSLKRLWYHWYRLQAALNDAHYKDVIQYLPTNHGECCELHAKLKRAIEDHTKKAIAESVQESIREKVRGY